MAKEIDKNGLKPKKNRERTGTAGLDRKDFALLRALEADATLGLEGMARITGLAASSVHERIRRLRRLGVIRNWTVRVDAPSVGLGVLAFVEVRASKPCALLVAALQAVSAVEECYSVAGRVSMLLKVRAAKPEALLDITDQLRRIPGVEGTETTIVLKTQFERGILRPE